MQKIILNILLASLLTACGDGTLGQLKTLKESDLMGDTIEAASGAGSYVRDLIPDDIFRSDSSAWAAVKSTISAIATKDQIDAAFGQMKNEQLLHSSKTLLFVSGERLMKYRGDLKESRKIGALVKKMKQSDIIDEKNQDEVDKVISLIKDEFSKKENFDKLSNQQLVAFSRIFFTFTLAETELLDRSKELSNYADTDFSLTGLLSQSNQITEDLQLIRNLPSHVSDMASFVPSTVETLSDTFISRNTKPPSVNPKQVLNEMF